MSRIQVMLWNDISFKELGHHILPVFSTLDHFPKLDLLVVDNLSQQKFHIPRISSFLASLFRLYLWYHSFIYYPIRACHSSTKSSTHCLDLYAFFQSCMEDSMTLTIISTKLELVNNINIFCYLEP